MRRAPSIDALIPALYLKGISTGDFTEALEAILGEGVSGLSAANIVRLKASWEEDYKAWSQRDLTQKRYVYWWADGVYFNVRLDEERTCVLVLIGATEEGNKELIAVVDGYRESSQSWRELLGQLKRLGLTTAPKLAIGDGSLGFWIALQEEYGSVAQQRCWVHKTANILDKMPKSVQAKAKQLIHEMYLAPTRKAGLAAYEQFISSYQVKFPKACECLQKDKETLFTFYDFPAQHWPHLRTTNPIESTFAYRYISRLRLVINHQKKTRTQLYAPLLRRLIPSPSQLPSAHALANKLAPLFLTSHSPYPTVSSLPS